MGYMKIHIPFMKKMDWTRLIPVSQSTLKFRMNIALLYLLHVLTLFTLTSDRQAGMSGAFALRTSGSLQRSSGRLASDFTPNFQPCIRPRLPSRSLFR